MRKFETAQIVYDRDPTENTPLEKNGLWLREFEYLKGVEFNCPC